MDIKKAVLMYFSPTGGTKKAAELLGERLGMETETLDITAGAPERRFMPGELAVFAFPVYGGRIPAPMYERLKTLRGLGTPAVLLAVYGNRAVEDALLEMEDAARLSGFIAIAAAEVIAPHSIVPQFGAGRPDGRDLRFMDNFAFVLRDRLITLISPEPVTLPGGRPYRDYKGVPMKPAVSAAKCFACGACFAHCPAGAIPRGRPQKTDKERCISCMGCISVCPSGARPPSRPMKLAAQMSLKKVCAERKEPKYYI